MAALTPRLISPCCRSSVHKAVSGTKKSNSTGEIHFQQNPSKTIHTDPSKTSQALLDNFRRQIQNVSKVRDSLTNVVSFIGAISIELPNPGRYLPDYHRYIPGISSRRKPQTVQESETVVKSPKSVLADKDKANAEMNLKCQVRLKEAPQIDVPVTENDAFEKVMQDTHESVRSYFKSVGSPEDLNMTLKQNSERKSVAKTEEEEEGGLFSKFVKMMDPSPDKKPEKIPIIRKDFVSRAALCHRTRSLVQALKTCDSDSSRLVRTEELCKHILNFPETRSIAVTEGLLPILLRLRKSSEVNMKGAAREALALAGYIDPVKRRGIRILTVDGGGTKGLVAIETMKKLEEACQTDITELFDMVCGVSTGALILAMVFMFHVPLQECELMYKELSTQMFSRNKFVGTGQLVWNHAFYDTEMWENILKENLGEHLMINSSRNPNVAKMACFSCLMNAPKLKNFIFRNYNLPPEVFSQYPGNCKQKVWEAIRASSAAPGYYEECRLGDFIHQDGGVLSNNPTALGIHEGKLLWPQESIQCVVSLGNGRHEPSLELSTGNKLTLKDKVSKIVDSATDTEAVHTTLQDLMAPSTYFRFNPYLSEDFMLDEIRPDKQESMQRDAQLYLRKNDLKIQRAAEQLMLSRLPHQKTADWLRLRADMM